MSDLETQKLLDRTVRHNSNTSLLVAGNDSYLKVKYCLFPTFQSSGYKNLKKYCFKAPKTELSENFDPKMINKQLVAICA